jgi:hypothetical protein
VRLVVDAAGREQRAHRRLEGRRVERAAGAHPGAWRMIVSVLVLVGHDRYSRVSIRGAEGT